MPNGPLTIPLGSKCQAFSPLSRHDKLEGGGNSCEYRGETLEHTMLTGNHLLDE
jgi:hypothetical protein